MSKIQVNEVVNHFDNGAPDFPRGVTVTGVSTFSGAVSVGGTLTYEDVTSIDSVGIITAQAGINVTGGIQVGTGATIDGSTNTIIAQTNGSEAARIDSSGRFLIGTTSTSNNGLLMVKGNPAVSTGQGEISITKGSGVTGADQELGYLNFGEGSANTAVIKGVTAANWTSGSDRPTNMTFETTPSSSGSPTERMRITAAGNVGIATDMTSQNVMLGVFGDGTGSKKPATIYQNPLTGTGTGNGFYVGINHNDQTGYVWNYEADALSFATNNVQRVRIDSDGYMTVAPSGMVIRSGFYDTGTGSGARTVTASETFITANINGTGQVGHNIGKFSDDGLTYTKVSSNSHLNISVSFPFYVATGAAGFGIRGMLSTNDGSNYYTMSGLTNGPANGWGAGGYGGNSAGVFNYTWNTRMNSSQASTILAKTGTIRFYFQVKVWSGTDTLTFIDYPSYPKKGSIVVQEIAE